ncbi:hypothetical protein Tco_0523003 [Tanacetum coccineum]
MELEDYVLYYIPEPEHPENLVPAEDEAPTPLLPPSFLSLHASGLSEADHSLGRDYYSLLFRPGCEVGESSAAVAARQPGPTMAHRVDHSHVDTMETRFGDIERRMMTALKMVNMRVSYQVDVRSIESSEFYTRICARRIVQLRHEWQRQAADDFAVSYNHGTQAWRWSVSLTNWRTMVAGS